MTDHYRREETSGIGGQTSRRELACYICDTAEQDAGYIGTCNSCAQPFCDDLECQNEIDSRFCSECMPTDKLADTYFRFGALWHEGKHQPIDHGRAIAWYRRAVSAGSLPAQTNLGTLLLNRWNRTDEDLKDGVGLLHDAANSGDKKAAWNYALCLDRGLVSDSDPIQAARWYYFAASKGDSHAAYNLGAALAEDESREISQGLGDLDLGSPEEWYEIAAEKNCPHAQMRLATGTTGLGSTYRPTGDPIADIDYRLEQIGYEWSSQWELIAHSGHPAAYCVVAYNEDTDDSRKAFFLLQAAARGFEPGLDTFRGYWNCLPMGSAYDPIVTRIRVAAGHTHGRGPYDEFNVEDVHNLSFRYSEMKYWCLAEVDPPDSLGDIVETLEDWFGWHNSS